MAHRAANRQGPRAQEMRAQAGAYLQSLRTAQGMSQLELSRALGYDYYSFISQVELGASRVPAESYGDWAKALGVDKREFVLKLFSFYDPVTYGAIFPRGVPDDLSSLDPKSSARTSARAK